jgi:hypothetical protein
MLTVKFRHTGRDETLILSAVSVDIQPENGVDGYSVSAVDTEGRTQTFLVSNRDDDFNVAFVEGAMGATTQVVRPRVRGN